MAPSLLLLAAFVVQSLLVVSLCWLVSDERIGFVNTAVLGTSSGPRTIVWIDEAEETIDVS